MSARAWLCRVAVLSASIAAGVHAAPVSIASQTPDHYEFSGSLNVPFHPDAHHPDAHGSYPLTLYFDYPGAGSSTLAAWQVDVTDAHGHSVRRWIGEIPMPKQHVQYRLAWDGHDNAGHAVPAGFYTVRLRAVPTVHGKSDFGASLGDRVKGAFDLFRSEQEDQSYDVMVGNVPAPKMPAFHALPHGAQAASAKGGAHTQSVPATGSLPYTIYYGNLHSQTNHSDGAGPLATCVGEQNPQSGQYGPPDAYAMMQNQAGGDFLMASEHNHMFDGSTSTNLSANPATAKALFASGLTDMANYNAAHPGFLALYGVEWGVISNGGHMNIFNADGLPEWEYNSSGQLIGDYYTPKSDYAGIYATMAAHGWIGMFNHPAASGQFNIGGTDLAYDSNGDQVMVLAEVLNSYAFSTNTTQTESELNSYQPAFNILLERGYHVAPASDQDNHCSNWGLSYTNRDGVLLPTGTTLNVANFLDALRARHVFATEDKTGQLILTANGNLMGQTISNSGALTLVANYASTSGQTASRVQFFTGVPGSNGTVTQLYEGSGSTTTTPAVGAHF
ncbi:MAG TPA: FlgD immunoglobulin-like domain containing protein, partial [Xanthomonadaceae bacterium]|nr:FlgD immunoglobulin-like domain containing protein [Xanthomonadaceae bacterium]